MHRHLVLAHAILQPEQEALVVFVVAKNILAVIPLLNDMMGFVGDDKSGQAGHGATL
jgi:hypothetical protein